MWKLPVLIVNFKLYRQGSGENARKLLRIMEMVSEETGINLIAALNPLDMGTFGGNVKIPLIIQHADAVEFGAHTGRINLEVAREKGAEGALINHSERRLTIADIDYLIQRARELGMLSIVCTNNPRVSGALAFLNPDFIAMEPPELIGGDISVSKAKPEAITETIDAVKSIRNIPVLVGAGIKSGEDVRRAIELGAQGVLVASGVVKSKDPEKSLRDLIEGMM